MLSQVLPHGSSLPAGGVTMTDEKSIDGLLEAAASQGFLAIELPAPGPGARASLSLHIEEAIEVSLCRRGAAAPGVGASVDLDASLSDQLYRARLIEFKGIAISVPTLEGITNLGGTLDAEDSQTLKWWFEATRERPILIFVDQTNLRHSVYPSPVPFSRLLKPSGDDAREASRATAPEQAQSSAAMDLSEPPPQVAHTDAGDTASELVEGEPTHTLDADSPEQPANDADWAIEALDPESADEHDERVAKYDDTLLADLLDAFSEPAPEVESYSGATPEQPEEDVAAELEPSVDAEADAKLAPDANRDAALEPDTDSQKVDLSTDSLLASLTPDPPNSDGSEPSSSTLAQPTTSSKREGRGAGPKVVEDLAKRLRDAQQPSPVHAEFARVAREQWKTWVEELNSTRGPKPLAVVERTFVSSYVPLREAYSLGIAADEAREPLRTFAESFEQSYSEAFDALRIRGKRPTMVLDIPDIAQRVGRLHGARSIQLLLVDAMRFDLGLRVQDRLRVLARGNASLAERLLLWSALPTHTAQQLDLIGKGPSGLREPSTVSDTSSVVARGKSATTLRRIKAGHRELYKLDVVQARLDGPGATESARLDDIADETSEAIANHFLKLPPRTLVMVFGDHGFLLDSLDGGTAAAHSGGATPEEVLVPAFAWLIGRVH